MSIVQDTWEEVGHKVRPHRKKVMVRTYPLSETTPGGIFLPKSGFYDGMANLKVLDATVVSKGADVNSVNEGDKVILTRIVFARYQQLKDRTYVGWVDETEILGIVED